jgi:hypothetical protein
MAEPNLSLSRNGSSNPLGKLVAERKVSLPEIVDERVTALAALRGKPVSEYIRDVLTEHVLGRFDVVRLATGDAERSAGIGREQG